MVNPRRKRDPYTRFACTICKRRKIKCSGETPCAVCVANGTDCVYERYKRRRTSSSRTKSAQSSRHPDHNYPSARREPVESSQPEPSPPQSHTQSHPHSQSHSHSRSPEVRNRFLPGSSDYFLNLADEIHTKITSPKSNSPQSSHESVNLAELLGKAHRQQANPKRGHEFNVIHSLGAASCLEVIRVYEDEIGQLYPFLDLASLRKQVAEVANHRSSGSPSNAAASTRYDKAHLNSIMVLMLATTSVLHAPDSADQAEPFTDETRKMASYVTTMESVSQVHIEILILVSIYHFMTDREILAWRNIGAALRLLQELGFHNSTSLQQQFPSITQRQSAKRLLWCAYTLDRRWSFGTGLPFGIAESNIDYDMEIPDDLLSSIYLKSMVAYCRITTECRNSIIGGQLVEDSTGMESDFSDFRVTEWRRRLPQQLQLDPMHWRFNPRDESRSQYRMRLLLYLRANQMRMVIRRQSVFKCTSPEAEAANIQTMVQVAQDTIRILNSVAKTCDLYQSQQRTFNHFLETAISSLLMSVARSKSLDDAASVSSVKTAMELISNLSTSSSMMRRLYERLESLKIVRVILQSRPTTTTTRTIDAATDSNPTASNAANQRLDAISMNSPRGSVSRRHSIHVLPEIGSQLRQNTLLSDQDANGELTQLPTVSLDPNMSAFGSTVRGDNTATSNIYGDLPSFDMGTLNASTGEPSDPASLDNFPYVYFSDLQSMLDMDANTFMF